MSRSHLEVNEAVAIIVKHSENMVYNGSPSLAWQDPWINLLDFWLVEISVRTGKLEHPELSLKEWFYKLEVHLNHSVISSSSNLVCLARKLTVFLQGEGSFSRASFFLVLGFFLLPLVLANILTTAGGEVSKSLVDTLKLHLPWSFCDWIGNPQDVTQSKSIKIF